QLDALPPEKRAEQLAAWRAEEDQRREQWQTARAMWEIARTGRPPWPFDEENVRREVVEFVKATYRPDDPTKSRLSQPNGDFDRAVHEDVERSKQLTIPAGFSLGPSRPAEFKPDVRKALEVLEERLTPSEATTFKGLEGRWPEYPRELVRLARQHNVHVPGCM